MAHELLDLHRHTEELLQYGGQALRVSYLTNQGTGVEQLGLVRHGIAVAQRRWCHAHKRSDIRRKAVRVGTISIDVRLGLGPGSIEERQKPMLKQIEKPDEGGVAGLPRSA